jgi:DNA-directed RNA polymerase subunit RPC12/RpoP
MAHTSSFEEMCSRFPCPTCGELREVKSSIKKKPYFFCDSCGVQVFIRGKTGINRLIEIQNNSTLRNRIETLGGFESSRLLQLKTQIFLIASEISRISDSDTSNWLLRENSGQINALKSKLSGLEAEYLTLLSGGPKPVNKPKP